MRRNAIFVFLALPVAITAGCGSAKGITGMAAARPNRGPAVAANGFAAVSVTTISGATINVTLPQRNFTFTTTGNTYYVAENGSDTAAGSLTEPWATVDHALAVAVAGDIIYLRAGTYPPFAISKSGAVGKPLIVSSYPGEQARIIQPRGWQQKNPHGATVTLTGCTYVWLHGFYIEGCMGQPRIPPPDTYGQNGITLQGGAGLGCRILNNTITRAQHCGIKEMNHGGMQFLIEGNVIYENGVNNSTDHGIYAPALQITVRGNACFRNAAFGIHFIRSSPAYCYIYDNVCFDNGASGIMIGSPRNVIAHNVCARNGEFGLFLYRSDCKSNKFLNNILLSNVLRQIDMDNAGSTDPLSYPSNNTIDYNDIYPQTNWATSLVASWCGTHQLFADPLVVDSTNNNYQLQPGSPCLGAAGAVTLKGALSSPNIGLFPATLFTDDAGLAGAESASLQPAGEETLASGEGANGLSVASTGREVSGWIEGGK